MDRHIFYKDQLLITGTGNDLHRISYVKLYTAHYWGHLRQVPYSPSPSEYLGPGTGYRYRFPFPDEDNLPFGEIGEHPKDRALSITIDRGEPFSGHGTVDLNTKKITLEIVYQQVVLHQGEAVLATGLRNPYNNENWVEYDDQRIAYLINQIERHYVTASADPAEVKYWFEITDRIRRRYFVR